MAARPTVPPSLGCTPIDASANPMQLRHRARRSLTVIREWVTTRRTYAKMLLRLSPRVLHTRTEVSPSLSAMWNIQFSVDVIVYFPDDPLRIYQVEQWLPVLERLNEQHSVHVLTRNLASFRILQETTSLGILYARRVRDLNHMLQHSDPKLCLYVNNSGANFQMLSWPRLLHVHLNHGESDKISMASNQAKAYDRVFVAGDAAVDRYKTNLIDFDGSSLVPVGRPQLDIINSLPLPKTEARTVMYAPTWEGETDAMNYTSVPAFGDRLVRLLAKDASIRVVYKPHPRVVTGTAPVVAAHERIVAAIRAANEERAPRDRHVIALDGSILDLMASCDALISDVSSVALDWLYLHTDRPLWMTNPRGDVERLLHASPAASGSYLMDAGDIDTAPAEITASIADDKLRDKREELRRYYFGDLATGQSTKRFLDEIGALIARRDELVGTHDADGSRIELE